MTNIEFLVDELRKAKETISNLRKVNADLLSKNRMLTTQNKDLRRKVNEDYSRLGDLDALEALKKKMQETA